VRFCAGSVDVFVSCGADGSVRMFDLRSLEHSTIIYEPSDKPTSERDKGKQAPTPIPQAKPLTENTGPTPPSAISPNRNAASQTPTSHLPNTPPPLLRLAASPHDSHLLATFAADSPLIRILDVRQPGTALLELRGHTAALNAVEWSPSRRGMLASGADDALVLVWDLLRGGGAVVNGEGTGVGNGVPGATGTQGSVSGTPTGVKGPGASWRCEFEVAGLSWAPSSVLTQQGGEWVGVAAGRGVWGVKV
jgi:WD repeat-containing protein 68